MELLILLAIILGVAWIAEQCQKADAHDREQQRRWDERKHGPFCY